MFDLFLDVNLTNQNYIVRILPGSYSPLYYEKSKYTLYDSKDWWTNNNNYVYEFSWRTGTTLMKKSIQSRDFIGKV